MAFGILTPQLGVKSTPPCIGEVLTARPPGKTWPLLLDPKVLRTGDSKESPISSSLGFPLKTYMKDICFPVFNLIYLMGLHPSTEKGKKYLKPQTGVYKLILHYFKTGL